MSDVITHFRMGSDIPDWLLTMEPAGPQSVRGAFRFGADVDVIEAAAYYVVLPSHPLEQIAGILDGAGSVGCNVLATSKPVRIMQTEVVPYPLGMTPPGAPTPYMICIQPHATVPAQRQSLGRRLRWLLTGA